MFPLQSSRFIQGVNPWNDSSGCIETIDYVLNRLGDVVRGKVLDQSQPPPLDLCYSHVIQASSSTPLNDSKIQKFIHSGKRHAATASILSSHPYIPPHTHPHIFPLFNPAALDVLVFWEIPSENRSGNLFVSGLNLGAMHSPLRDIVEAAENAKVGRSMYAETQREKEEVVQAIRNSEWNMEMNPLHVTVHASNNLNHDFTKGPCRARVNLTVRNYSTTLKSRFTLKLNREAANSSWGNVQPAVYGGRLTYRATLEPTQYISFSAAAWIGRPGTYALGAWQIETEVLESLPNALEQVRHRYLQEPPLDDSPFITVCHVRRTNL